MSIQGRLKDMGLADIIQVFHMQNKTTAIRVGSEQGYGMVYMRGGRVVHATYRDLTGEEAFYQLIGWGDGEFEVETNLTAPDTTIHADVEHLLLESAKRLDEDGLSSKQRKSPCDDDVESALLVKRLVETGVLESMPSD